MIGEPEVEGDGGDPEGAWTEGASADVVRGGVRGARTRPWPWVLGAVVATSAVWALVLQLSGYGKESVPDLHHYRISGSPCGGSSLKPLTDALGAGHVEVFPADTQTGPALDQAACTLTAQRSVGTHWQASYSTVVTVQLHKKTDPAAEFDDVGSSRHTVEPVAPSDDGSGTTTAILATAGSTHVVRVPDLGDRAYLLTSGRDETLTVLHGGAVLTVAVDVQEKWTGPGAVPPPDADGIPQRPPRQAGYRAALVATMRGLMSALSGPATQARNETP
ncbi:hypothetical protein AB0399_35220 [Streptomyces sp. NPDC088194]|uniref:hypothetical protein n=1 Tax=Streptomyces sp. NPDC088194 TaxID=3154931 RepID=UPI00344D51E2